MEWMVIYLGNELLPQKLKELRKANGYTQDYVASFLGVVRQTYSHYETGLRKPGSETLYKLAGLYNISIEDFMQLIISLDQTIYYDAPASTQSGKDLSDFLDYVNEPCNVRKLRFLTYSEKELLFYFEQISEEDKRDIIEFIKIKTRKYREALETATEYK